MGYGFHKKIFLKIALVIMLIAGAVIIALSATNVSKIMSNYQKSFTEISLRTSSEYNSLIQDMNSLSISIVTNSSIRKAFKEASSIPMSDKALYSLINDAMVPLLVPSETARFRINMYNDQGNFITMGIPYSKELVQAYLNSDGFMKRYNGITFDTKGIYISPLQEDVYSDRDSLCFSLYRELNYYQYSISKDGIVEIQCPYSQLDKVLSANNNSYIQTFLLDEAFEVIYSSASIADESLQQYIDQYKIHAGATDSDIAPFSYKNKEYFCNIIPLDSGGYLLQTENLSILSNLFRDSVLVICFISAFIIAACLYTIFQIIKMNTKPLRELTDKAANISIEDASLTLDTSGYPAEFIALTEAFDDMLSRLHNSMEENVKSKEHELRANMIALQSQMDPHFLFNMLSVIKAFSKENDTATIELVCDYLSSILRYISNYLDHTATIGDELAHAENYLKLMKIRYEENFSYTIHNNAFPDISTMQIPKLVLQPILENCFKHGFKKTLPPWQITIHCYCVNHYDWVISVSDNGIGFDEASRKKLYEKVDEFSQSPIDSLESFKIGGMGLVNTLIRLKLKYKENFFFQLDNLEAGGTCISIGGRLDYDEFIAGRG